MCTIPVGELFVVPTLNSLPAEMNEVIYFCVMELYFTYVQY